MKPSLALEQVQETGLRDRIEEIVEETIKEFAWNNKTLDGVGVAVVAKLMRTVETDPPTILGLPLRIDTTLGPDRIMLECGGMTQELRLD